MIRFSDELHFASFEYKTYVNVHNFGKSIFDMPKPVASKPAKTGVPAHKKKVTKLASPKKARRAPIMRDK